MRSMARQGAPDSARPGRGVNQVISSAAVGPGKSDTVDHTVSPRRYRSTIRPACAPTNYGAIPVSFFARPSLPAISGAYESTEAVPSHDHRDGYSVRCLHAMLVKVRLSASAHVQWSLLSAPRTDPSPPLRLDRCRCPVDCEQPAAIGVHAADCASATTL